MLHHTNSQQMNSIQSDLNINTYHKVLTWARLNFELQDFLLNADEAIGDTVKKQLKDIGYEGRSIEELSETELNQLFESESFFSSSTTGKRIASYALKTNGLNPDGFSDIEESITLAYTNIQSSHQENTILEKSYTQAMNTLCIFKP